ncbi:MAG TPA: L-histidine N(alpha)-methyltransferase [Verrucomicrobiae bacterium]|nr:L-histidine N(alpha)-methyltransferase [Verrucomicrobiae bacterium]
MSTGANVQIHASQFPEQIRRDLFRSLRTRRIDHKFHYDSVKQTQKWLALHQRFSPSRNNENCRAIYENSFAAAAKWIKKQRVHLIGLGCGGGQKDTLLLAALKRRTKNIFYTPCDVATAMVLTARQAALPVLPESQIFPVVCDLQTATDLPFIFDARRNRGARRIITFFGMIPNFEPRHIFRKLTSLLGPTDILLFSANLAPAEDYAAGVKRVLPQYENALTRDWLMTFLTDLGISKNDGALFFKIEAAPNNLKRIVSYFCFKRACKIQIGRASFAFAGGDNIRLFYSYRYTPDRIRAILSSYKFQIHAEWLADSGEEGVFLCTTGS